MEHKKPKFRLRLNLFDGIVLVLALCAAVFLAYRYLKPAANAVTGEPAPQNTVRYTLRLNALPEGTHEHVQVGDQLTDNIRNCALGTVVSFETAPSRELMLDESQRAFVLAEVTGCEDIYLTVESPCSVSDQYITVGGDYIIQVGRTVYVRGEGYFGSSVVVDIDREDMQ